MVAAQHHGATFRFRANVVSVDQRDGRVRGVTLASGERCAAPVVVNVAGPHSSHINGLARLPSTGVQTRPLRQEVDVVPCPDDFRLEAGGLMVADTDLGTYFRPSSGRHPRPRRDRAGVRRARMGGRRRRLRRAADGGDLGTPDDPRGSTAAEPRRPLTTHRARRALRRVGRLGADLRPHRPCRVLRRHRHQWKSVQERPDGRDPHGRAHPARARPVTTTTPTRSPSPDR